MPEAARIQAVARCVIIGGLQGGDLTRAQRADIGKAAASNVPGPTRSICVSAPDRARAALHFPVAGG